MLENTSEKNSGIQKQNKSLNTTVPFTIYYDSCKI